jgi:hypothetical protein
MSSQLFDKLTQYTVRHIGLVAHNKQIKKKKQKQQERIEGLKETRRQQKQERKTNPIINRTKNCSRPGFSAFEYRRQQKKLAELTVPPDSFGWRRRERCLEMDGTITKLRTQVDEFAKKFEGKIMPNNIEITLGSYEFRKKARYTNGGLKADEKFITLDKFTNNLKHIHGKAKVRAENKVGTFLGINQKDLVTVPPEIKIYNVITPILTTMLGAMKKQQDEIKKQQDEIKNLQEQLDKC